MIEWRKRYRKYKPLTVVKKCTACGEKKIKDAYHVICGDCVKKTSKCGKCLLPQGQWIKEGEAVPFTGDLKAPEEGAASECTESEEDNDSEDCEESGFDSSSVDSDPDHDE